MVDWKIGTLAFVLLFSLKVALLASSDRSLSSAIFDETQADDLGGADSISYPSPGNDGDGNREAYSELCPEHPCRCCPAKCRAGRCACCFPQWTATADALFLTPSATAGQRILFDPLAETILLNSSDMTFPVAVGPRLSLIRHGSSDWNFELNYFGIVGPKASADFPTSVFPGGIGSLILNSLS
jgi:hypothetical protein